MPFSSESNSSLRIPETAPVLRLDLWLVEKFPDRSRSEIQNWIRTGLVSVPGLKLRPGSILPPGTELKISPPEASRSALPGPEDLPLRILYEDEDLVAVNKFPGQVVHPAPGHPGGTVLNAMLYRYPEMSMAGDPLRPGLVHRLDASTSGILLFARNPQSLQFLQKCFKQRSVKKIYHALCFGIPSPCNQTVNLPIGRHPVHRQKRAVHGQAAREALTHFRLLQGLAGGTGGKLEVEIHTGRTHQIRVHLAHCGNPVLGDTVYAGKKVQLPAPWPKAERAMLHAALLEVPHPSSGEILRIEAPYPEDMIQFLSQL